MVKINYLNIIAVSALTLILSACTPQPEAPSHVEIVPNQSPQVEEHTPTTVTQNEEHIDLSQKSQTFHSGMNAGCSTAKGKYSKDSTRFSGEADYKEGWFYGRRKCQAHKAV